MNEFLKILLFMSINFLLSIAMVYSFVIVAVACYELQSDIDPGMVFNAGVGVCLLAIAFAFLFHLNWTANRIVRYIKH